MLYERTLTLSASLKVRVIQILSLNTPQTPSCEGCRKPIWTNLSHVNKADFGYSGGVLREEEGKIGWQITDSKAQLLSSSSRFKRHSDRCCQSTQDILYEKVASSLHIYIYMYINIYILHIYIFSADDLVMHNQLCASTETVCLF